MVFCLFKNKKQKTTFYLLRAWRDGSAVKKALAVLPEDSKSSCVLCGHCMHLVHRHMFRQNTYTHKKFIKVESGGDLHIHAYTCPGTPNIHVHVPHTYIQTHNTCNKVKGRIMCWG